MAEAKLKDPIAGKDVEKAKATEEKETEVKNINTLSFDDFEVVEERTERTPHPFDGYPMEKVMFKFETMNRAGKLEVNEVERFKAYVVALNPKEHVHQDPSQKGVSVGKKGTERIIDLESYHNRIVQDIENGGVNIDVVFDRKLVLEDGRHLVCAIVPSHSARAALIYRLDRKTAKVKVDGRYMLADGNQRKPLLRVFRMINSKEIATIKESNLIMGEDA